MPGLVSGIHVLRACDEEGVDGGDRPGHDGVAERRNMQSKKLAPRVSRGAAAF
jgi:hypothetical protein